MPNAELEAWKNKMVNIFHFLKTGMVFEIVNLFNFLAYLMPFPVIKVARFQCLC